MTAEEFILTKQERCSPGTVYTNRVLMVHSIEWDYAVAGIHRQYDVTVL